MRIGAGATNDVIIEEVAVTHRTRRAWSLFFAFWPLLLLAPRPVTAATDPWWGQDKALHFSTCLMFAGDGYATASVLSQRDSHRLLAGFGFAVAAGAGKEAYDRAGGGDASMRDFAWDVVGGATGAAISWLIDRYLF